ncbi:MAG TPA: hypothetical protein VHL34_18610 [Rhizomicrobium sp.]|jgi:hypothetical protein|nr:hypothetical protein [Rhizomicrobium sp.]
MKSSPSKAVANYRRRQQKQGMVRVEVQVPKADAALMRGVAQALSDPAREKSLRAWLQQELSPVSGADLKALLASAPLEGVDLTRNKSVGRKVEL